MKLWTAAESSTEIEAQLRDLNSHFYPDSADYKTKAKHAEGIHHELGEPDCYIKRYVFWGLALAWWKTLHESALFPAVLINHRHRSFQYANNMLGHVFEYFPGEFVMPNSPFNIMERWEPKLEGDARWKCDAPPKGNTHVASIPPMFHHLAPNGPMSYNSGGGGDIPCALTEAHLVGCMVALPGLLSTNTWIPTSTEFLTKRKVECCCRGE